MWRKFLGLALAASVSVAAGPGDDRRYELLSATLDGQLTMAIVERDGMAIAVRLDPEPEIMRGLAAGTVVQDLRAAVAALPPGRLQIASGLAHSEVRVDGTVQVRRANPAEAAAAIDGLSQLTDEEKSELKAMLSL